MSLFRSFLPPSSSYGVLLEERDTLFSRMHGEERDTVFGGTSALSCTNLESQYETYVNLAWKYEVGTSDRARLIKKADSVAAKMKKKKCTRTVGDIADEVLAAFNAPKKNWDPAKNKGLFQFLAPPK